MQIKDKFIVSDSGFIKGVVTMKKKDGTIIFTKENMIVQTGRDYFRELIILGSLPQSIITTKSFTPQFDGYVISHMGFGRSGTATILTQTDLASPDEGFIFSLTESYIDLDADQKAMVFKGIIDNINGSYGFSSQELGLYITDEAENNLETKLANKKLISRIVFDPIPVPSGDEYEVEYYIYF